MIKFNFFYANFTLDAPKALCYLSNKYYFAAVKFYHAERKGPLRFHYVCNEVRSITKDEYLFRIYVRFPAPRATEYQ